MRIVAPAIAVIVFLSWVSESRGDSDDYFAIHVAEEATGRGMPLVQLETTDKSRYYTDSDG